MTSHMDFRNRTRSVRESARQHLVRLREERLAARPGRAPLPVAEVEPPPETLPPPPVEEAAILEVPSPPADPLPLATEEEAPRPRPKAKRKSPAGPKAPSLPQTAEDQRICLAALAEMSTGPASPSCPSTLSTDEAAPFAPPLDDPLPEVGSSEGPEPDAPPSAVAGTTASEPAPPQSPVEPFVSEDLRGLPGAGPGLIWMLGQCGIRSLSDLAACDPAELSSRLGLVGQILDVGIWRDVALRLVEERGALGAKTGTA